MFNIPQRAINALAIGLASLVAQLACPVDHAYASLVRVTGVTLQEMPDELRVSIATTGPARYQQRAVRPEWMVVDIAGAELGIPPGTVPQGGGVVSQIRVGQFRPDVVRVVVEMTKPMHARLDVTPDGTAIIVGIPVRGTSAYPPIVTAGSGKSSRSEVARLTGITLWGTPARPWVTITTSGPVRYQQRSTEPNLVVVDVSKAQLALTSGKPPAGRGLVKQIRADQLAPDVVRVVVELMQPVSAHIATAPDRAVIVVGLRATARTGPPSAQGQPADNVQASTPAPPDPTGQPSPGRAPAPELQAGGSRQAPAPAGSDPLPPGAGYLLGPEDVLEITVWGHADLTRVVPVRPDGQIAVPLASTLRASGRSVEQLTRDLTRAFAKYIINPQVTVIVKEFRKVRVSVLGQVAHPGTFTLPPGARVLDAVSIASGVNDNAALNQSQLVRASGENRTLSLDALLLQQDMSQNLVLEPGDTILVPEDTKNKFYVVGDVNHAGVFPLKGEVTVLEALATAGGPVLHGTSTSATVHIVRRLDPAEGPLTANAARANGQPIANSKGVLLSMDLHKIMGGDLRQNETVRPGDVIVVPAPGIAVLPTILSILPFFFWLK